MRSWVEAQRMPFFGGIYFLRHFLHNCNKNYTSNKNACFTESQKQKQRGREPERERAGEREIQPERKRERQREPEKATDIPDELIK